VCILELPLISQEDEALGRKTKDIGKGAKAREHQYLDVVSFQKNMEEKTSFCKTRKEGK